MSYQVGEKEEEDKEELGEADVGGNSTLLNHSFVRNSLYTLSAYHLLGGSPIALLTWYCPYLKRRD